MAKRHQQQSQKTTDKLRKIYLQFYHKELMSLMKKILKIQEKKTGKGHIEKKNTNVLNFPHKKIQIKTNLNIVFRQTYWQESNSTLKISLHCFLTSIF